MLKNRAGGAILFYGALSGLVAGAALLAFQMGVTLLLGEDPYLPLRLAASLVQGGDALTAVSVRAFSGIGLMVYMGLSLVYGMLFSFILAQLTLLVTDPAEIIVRHGVLFGALVWAINHLLLARFVFTQFWGVTPIVTAVGHMLAFGVTLGLVTDLVRERIISIEFDLFYREKYNILRLNSVDADAPLAERIIKEQDLQLEAVRDASKALEAARRQAAIDRMAARKAAREERLQTMLTKEEAEQIAGDGSIIVDEVDVVEEGEAESLPPDEGVIEGEEVDQLTLSEETRGYLRAAGWQPGRSIDTTQMEESLTEAGFTVSPAVRAFLSRLGGLRVPYPLGEWQGRDLGRGEMDFTIEGIERDATLHPWMAEHYEPLIGDELCYIGWIDGDELFMDTTGRVYALLGSGELVQVGDNGPHFIEMVVQTHREYGQVVTG